MAEFGNAFTNADSVILTDIYAAGEAPIPGITVDHLYEKMKESAVREFRYVPRKQLAAFLSSFLKPQDTVVTLGAGDITHLSSEVIALLEGH